MRWPVIALLLVGCGPSVSSPTVSTTGESSTGTGSTNEPQTSATAGSTQATTSPTSNDTSSSSSGEPPEEVIVEGVWRRIESFKSPFQFQTCDGEWPLLEFPPDGEHVAGNGCAGRYLRARGVRGLVPGHLGEYEGIIVTEFLESRWCSPGDCGEPVCEPIACPSECDVFTQECSRDERCVPYSTDGGVALPTACVEVPSTPVPLGSTCTRDSETLSDDTCGAGATCLGGFGDREGICVELCQGPANNPQCEAGYCVVAPYGAPYCLATCSTAEQDCDGLCLSASVWGETVCVPEPGIPELFEPCEDGECTGARECGVSGPTAGLCVPA